MSVAALEAIALRRCLELREQPLARHFFRAAGKIVTPAWDMAVGGDLALPDIPGHRPLILRITNAYIERLLRVAERDPIVAQAFGDVSDLLAQPQEVLHPRILWRVLHGNLQRHRTSTAPSPPSGRISPSEGAPQFDDRPATITIHHSSC